MKTHYDRKAKEHDFKIGDKVLLREYMKQVGKNKKLSDKYRGPYTLIEQLSPVTFRLGDLENKRMNDTSHVNRMKHFPDIQNRDIKQPKHPFAHNGTNLEDPKLITTSSDDPVIQDPEIEDPEIEDPEIENPEIQNLEIQDLEFQDTELLEEQQNSIPKTGERSENPKIPIFPNENPKWPDIIEVINHRHKNQRIEYLIKQAGDPDSLAYWQKDTTLNNHPRVLEYLQNLKKPNTRSRTKNKTAIVYSLSIRHSKFHTIEQVKLIRPMNLPFHKPKGKITRSKLKDNLNPYIDYRYNKRLPNYNVQTSITTLPNIFFSFKNCQRVK
jgi:hypothetical protein